MTRETKIGVVVSVSFLCLVGIVLANKLRNSSQPPEKQEEQVKDDGSALVASLGPSEAEPRLAPAATPGAENAAHDGLVLNLSPSSAGDPPRHDSHRMPAGPDDTSKGSTNESNTGGAPAIVLPSAGSGTSGPPNFQVNVEAQPPAPAVTLPAATPVHGSGSGAPPAIPATTTLAIPATEQKGSGSPVASEGSETAGWRKSRGSGEKSAVTLPKAQAVPEVPPTLDSSKGKGLTGQGSAAPSAPDNGSAFQIPNGKDSGIVSTPAVPAAPTTSSPDSAIVVPPPPPVTSLPDSSKGSSGHGSDATKPASDPPVVIPAADPLKGQGVQSSPVPPTTTTPPPATLNPPTVEITRPLITSAPSAPPVISKGPVSISWDESIYRPQAGDTLQSISQQFYRDGRYAAALLEHNRRHALASLGVKKDPPELIGQTIYVPVDHAILDQKYPQLIQK